MHTNDNPSTASQSSNVAESTISIKVKYCGKQYDINDLPTSHTIEHLKNCIYSLTSIRPERQKLFGIKSKIPGQELNDDLTIVNTNLENDSKIMMIGSREDEIQLIKHTNKADLPPIVDDFDIPDDDLLSDVSIPNRQEYLDKITKRVDTYKINLINEPRPGKKLLVLDIDYTLFDHRSTAETAAELMRPYLHEFLTSAYEDYDIVIWSATSMKYIDVKMRELRVANNPNYKLLFYLDSAAMISVHSAKYGLLNVKPLAVIWGKFSQYNEKNTIMFDDIRRNFLMNSQNGLKIKAFREAHKNRDKDQELLHLAKYLKKIAKLEDLSTLNHKYWHRMLDGQKRSH